MFRTFLSNHVLANLAFALVLVVGFLAYSLLPRQKDPDMNFNWIVVAASFPGASAEDVERLVTDVLEEGIAKVGDIRHASSFSREGFSSILVRFQELDARVYDQRLNDLRREVRSQERELPPGVDDPLVLEITSASGFPQAMVMVVGQGDDENLRRQARLVKRDLERLRGVDDVKPIGLHDPELQVRFDPATLAGVGIAPQALADTVAGRFQDISGGSLAMGRASWLLRLEGTATDPEAMARWPVAGQAGEIPLGRVAEVVRGREKPITLARYQGRPAVLLAITKQGQANALELTDRIRAYAAQRQGLSAATGVEVILADDQTPVVREALEIMEGNALLGLGLVLVITWLFVGARMAVLISLGVPFALAGTFAVAQAMGWSLNVMVLLGVVIALGMLVDDAVVVVDAIHQRLLQGEETAQATLNGLREVFAPVVSSVLTTMAAFLPLVLLPGILGKFMRVIPLVVSLALAISLIEAFWMLPAHIMALRMRFDQPSRLRLWREAWLRRLRLAYGRLLVRMFRYPRRALAVAALPFAAALLAVAAGLVRVDFFAMDPMPIFYVNLELPPATPLEETLAAVEAMEQRVRGQLKPGEARALASYAGQMFTETEELFGERYGQVLVSLEPTPAGGRRPGEIAESMRAVMTQAPEAVNVTLLKLSGGPPVTRPISVKVRGETFAELRAAATELKAILAGLPAVRDITDNDSVGRQELVLRPNDDAARQAGLHPREVARLARLLGDGEVVARVQDRGEKVEVRVQARPQVHADLAAILHQPVALPTGEAMPLGQLTDASVRQGAGTIRHHNFRRTITVEADLDKQQSDTVTINQQIQAEWAKVQQRHPNVTLDFSGELDDIKESMDAILALFVLGVGLIYLILGTQFRSYFQPFLILTTVPMAFTGVILGLLLSNHPLSLYTLYGAVALTGVAVNSAIVLIDAANERRLAGMGVLHATLYAARRRLAPILITTITTIGGLLSLATGLMGQSLLWGPVATAIVWGLGFSTLLTLFLIPMLYGLVMHRHDRRSRTALP